MPTYSVVCTLQIPVAGDEPREISAIATFDDLSTEDLEHCAYGIEAFDGANMTDMPTNHPVYLKSYVVYLPTPGPTQLELDAELRIALGEHGWMVL